MTPKKTSNAHYIICRARARVKMSAKMIFFRPSENAGGRFVWLKKRTFGGIRELRAPRLKKIDCVFYTAKRIRFLGERFWKIKD